MLRTPFQQKQIVIGANKSQSEDEGLPRLPYILGLTGVQMAIGRMRKGTMSERKHTTELEQNLKARQATLVVIPMVILRMRTLAKTRLRERTMESIRFKRTLLAMNGDIVTPFNKFRKMVVAIKICIRMYKILVYRR